MNTVINYGEDNCGDYKSPFVSFSLVKDLECIAVHIKIYPNIMSLDFNYRRKLDEGYERNTLLLYFDNKHILYIKSVEGFTSKDFMAILKELVIYYNDTLDINIKGHTAKLINNYKD